MQQRILVEIDCDGSTTKYYASEDVVYSSQHYDGRIEDGGQLDESQSELFFGTKEISPLTVSLENTDGHFRELLDTYDLRGRTLTYKRVDLDAPSTLETVELQINSIGLDLYTCVITATREELDIWDKTIPSARITSDDFPNAPDEALEKPIATWFGSCESVPLYCINEDTDNDYYDFLIGYGTINQCVSVYRDSESAGSTKLAETAQLVDSAEYTFYDGSQGSPHGGFAFLRFIVEQRDSNNNLYNLYANISGIKISGTYTANPAECFKEFLENSTWGLGLTCESTSFAASKNQLSQAAFWMGGGLWDFKKASEWRDCFLLACGLGQLSKGTSGYELYVPKHEPSNAAAFDEHNMTVVSDGLRPIEEYVNSATLFYSRNHLRDKYTYEYTLTTGKTFGQAREFFSPFTFKDEGGQILCALIINRFKYQDRIIEFTTGQDAADLSLHDIITITHRDLNLSEARYEVIAFVKGADETTVTVAEYAGELFNPN